MSKQTGLGQVNAVNFMDTTSQVIQTVSRLVFSLTWYEVFAWAGS